jgi:hypothetical protein
VVTEGGGMDSSRRRQGDIEGKSEKREKNLKGRLNYTLYDKKVKMKEGHGENI